MRRPRSTAGAGHTSGHRGAGSELRSWVVVGSFLGSSEVGRLGSASLCDGQEPLDPVEFSCELVDFLDQFGLDDDGHAEFFVELLQQLAPQLELGAAGAPAPVPRGPSKGPQTREHPGWLAPQARAGRRGLALGRTSRITAQPVIRRYGKMRRNRRIPQAASARHGGVPAARAPAVLRHLTLGDQRGGVGRSRLNLSQGSSDET